MKQSLARIFVIISLILSLISFILSLIALNLSNWKYIQLRSTFVPSLLSDNHPMDPLIRGEVEKYIDLLYHRGETHSFGLSIHCVNENECGRNSLPLFHETDYGLCHSIQYHRQCIFSNLVLINNDNNYETKCSCQQPSYVKIIHKLLLFIIVLESLFIVTCILRLCRHRCIKACLNDIQLRLASLISSLFSALFLVIIIIQCNGNRLTEPLEFFESMRRHYSRIQIYTFSKDLEVIIRQLEHSLDARMGASYICILFTLVFISISLMASVTVEIKVILNSSFTMNDGDEKKIEHFQNSKNHIQIEPSISLERFVPSEQIRFPRQTKV